MLLLFELHKMNGKAVSVTTNGGVAALLCIQLDSDQRQALLAVALVKAGMGYSITIFTAHTGKLQQQTDGL